MYQRLISLFILLSIVSQNHANEAAKCGSQLKKAIRKDPDSVSINKATCPKSYTILMWLRAQKTASFTQAKVFLEKHPHWPRFTLIQRQLEKTLYESKNSPSQTIAWFRQLPPISVNGLKAFGLALLAQNQHDDQKFRQSFMDIDISPAEMKIILKSYRPLLTDQLLARKAHDQLNKNQLGIPELIRPLLSAITKPAIDARLALIKGASLAKAGAANDPNVLFEQVRLYRKNRQNEKASALLKKLTTHNDPEIVWAERNLIGRRFLEEKKYQAAYTTIKDHGLKKGENFANAEWLCGWLCLRFLKNPEQAKEHFDHLNENVSTPVSSSRAQYWLGRTYKELGEQDQAHSWWSKAKKHIATYYGQLAHKEVTGKYPVLHVAELTVDQGTRRSLESQELYKYMQLLQEIGEQSTAETFALTLGEQLKSSKEQALFTEIVRGKLGKHPALKVYKKIMKTTYPLIPAAYPRISIPKHTVDPAFAHAIIRQESRFQHDAISTAGATGLMQLMPATAALTEKRHKLKKKKLTDPQHNVQLGSCHLKDLMDKYQSSLILTAAAYNAGSSAVNEWIDQFGDPRASGVDVIDWIELIPYAETRNYVQRVLENYHCYRKHT